MTTRASLKFLPHLAVLAFVATLFAGGELGGVAILADLFDWLMAAMQLWPLTLFGVAVGAAVLAYPRMVAVAFGVDLVTVGAGMVLLDLVNRAPPGFVADPAAAARTGFSLVPFMVWAHGGHMLRLALWPQPLTWRRPPAR